MLPMFPEFPECLIDKVQVCRVVGRVLNSGQGTQEGLGEFLNGWFEETVQSGFYVLDLICSRFLPMQLVSMFFLLP